MSAQPFFLKALRSALWALSLLAGAASAQQKPEDDPNKVSNDEPNRPIQMPAASPEVREAFDDFDRFKRRGAWERATKALYAIPEIQTARFVDGSDNFIIPVTRKRHEVLTGLSPEGLAAYRLFYDTDAKKLLDAAEGTAEQANLEKLFSSYFLTTIGDNAADRLGDLYFEVGRYDRAADCWLAVLRERPDSDLAPALMTTKAIVALAKAGRRTEARALRSELLERYRDEIVTIGGKKAKAVDQVARLASDLDAPKNPAVASLTAGTSSATPPTLAGSVPATWQVRFGASVTAGMTPAEVSQWENNSLSLTIPRVAIEGGKLFANYLDHLFAVDLDSGKMLWRSASFHNVDITAMSDQARMIDPTRYAIVVAPGFVWSLGRDIKNLNMMAPTRLICRRADNGDIVWQSTDFADFEGIDFVGPPLLAPDTLLVAAKSAQQNMYGQDNQSKQFVLAIRPIDGKLLWKTEVGTFRSVQRYYYYGQRNTATQPRLTYHAGAVYLDTHVGILARLNLESGALEWGYGYPTEPVKQQGRFIFFGMTEDAVPVGGPPLTSGENLLIKGAKSDHLTVVDPGAMKVVWDRLIAKSARPIGADATTIYLGGPDLEALDRQSRVLRWSLPLPNGSEEGSALVRPDGLWQFTPRGIYEVDNQSGQVRRIFRGDDSGAIGGDLILTDQWLLAVSNQTISAYPRGGPDASSAAAKAGTEPAATTTKTRGSDE